MTDYGRHKKNCYLNMYSGNVVDIMDIIGIVTYGGWDRILHAIRRGTATATI